MESSNGMSQGQENISQPAPQTNVTQGATQQSEERLLKQSEVNDIVKNAKYKAVEDYKKLQTERPEYFEKKYGEAPQAQQHNNSDDHYRRIAQEEAQRFHEKSMQDYRTQMEMENANRIVQGFKDKFVSGREKYQDFDQIVGDPKNYGRFPNVVSLLSQYVDNAHDVLYDLKKDGSSKLVNLELMARDFPDEAILQAQRLSQSLKDNEAAGKVRLPNEPLSQLRPSNTGIDNGAMSVKDFRKKYKV